MSWVNYSIRSKIQDNKTNTKETVNNVSSNNENIVSIDEILNDSPKKEIVDIEYIKPPIFATIRGVPKNMGLDTNVAAKLIIKSENNIEMSNEISIDLPKVA